jgi:YgiT-type zinc finger domain-containing protein
MEKSGIKKQIREALMKRKYGDCLYCGGAVEEQQLQREVHWRGELCIIENVPMGVCVQCGEKFIKPHIAKQIDEILRKRGKPTKTINIPVFRYKSVVA